MDAPEFSHGRISPAELRRKITAKLLPGQDSAAHLRILLQSATATEQDKRALATKILTSITEAISILESAGEELSCPDHSLCSDLDSGESRRSRAVKDNPSRANKRRYLSLEMEKMRLLYMIIVVITIDYYCFKYEKKRKKKEEVRR